MEASSVPIQPSTPWGKVFEVASKSLKKRAIRASMTMVSVVLSIAFLTYSWINSDIINGLKALQDTNIDSLLMTNGIDPGSEGTSAKTKWLVMLSLMVSAIGILNAMLMSVTERIKEIGTMKCIGATNGFIVKLFIVEASIQGSIGTTLGVVFGLIIAIIMNVFTYEGAAIQSLNVVEALGSLGLAFVIGVGMTMLFAMYPAYMAAKMLPVEALRVEE